MYFMMLSKWLILMIHFSLALWMICTLIKVMVRENSCIKNIKREREERERERGRK